MGVSYADERGLLAEDERSMVERSHYPALAALDATETQELARWLRSRRARARDIMHDRVRARRGKGELRGAPSEPATGPGLGDKKQVFARALKRVNGRLDALAGEARRARHAQRMRAVLAAKADAVPAHPAGGDTAGRGMARKGAARRPGIVQGGRIGSVTRAGARRQAARDARG